MNMLGAIVCGILALVAGALGFTGVLKGFAGAAKAMFFGLLALAAVLGAAALYGAHRFGG